MTSIAPTIILLITSSLLSILCIVNGVKLLKHDEYGLDYNAVNSIFGIINIITGLISITSPLSCIVNIYENSIHFIKPSTLMITTILAVIGTILFICAQIGFTKHLKYTISLLSVPHIIKVDEKYADEIYI